LQSVPTPNATITKRALDLFRLDSDVMECVGLIIELHGPANMRW
jgi:hypothetical protein